jgi:hypothetical protein
VRDVRADELIDIDQQPELLTWVRARVEKREAAPPLLVPIDVGLWLAELRRSIGGELRVAFLRSRQKRSLRQNAYYWSGVLGTVLEGLKALALERGVEPVFKTKEDLHAALKHRFLGVTVRHLHDGEAVEIPPTTTKLTVKQFSDYVELISAWAAEKGIYVPSSDERIAA